MATVRCDDIVPMLGAFEDGELRGTEQQDVARHLAECFSCKTEMAATAALGEQLRAIAVEPDLAGFTGAVLERIAELTPPLHVRIRRYFESAREQLNASFALSAAALATAALTALLIAPYAARFVGHSPGQLASSNSAEPTVEFVENDVSPRIVTPVVEPRTVIASLESHVPSVAVWSAPENTTSVIWVSDQR